jgi:NOL1/NOP2/fmu family ribosome biogenesis protein
MNKEENEQQVLNLLHRGMELMLPDLRQFSDQIKTALVVDKIVGFYLLPGISSGEGLFFSVLKKHDSEYGKPKYRSLKLEPFNALDQIESIGFHEFNRIWHRSDQAYGLHISNELLARISDTLHFKSIGLPAYEMKGKSMIPLHGLAMLPATKPHIELDLENSLQFLRKQSISLPPNSGIGWKIVGFNGVSLGWLKIIPGRSNNYYPSYFRLRS